MIKISTKGLVAKLDKIFARYIRLHNSDENGYCHCCTCNAIISWDRCDNGHYVNRIKYATRWDEKNCHPQCRNCNRFDEGRKDDYRDFIENKYDKNMPIILKMKGNQFARPNLVELDVLIKFYTNRVATLKKEKNLS